MLMSFGQFQEMFPLHDRYSDCVRDRYAEYFRENAEVGDGVSVHLWSDSHAYTIIARTPKSLTIQRAKAEYSEGYKPEYVPGGFGAVCLNDDEQNWEITPDANGAIEKAYWSEKKKGFYVGGNLRVTAGYYEHFDHNF